MKWESYDTRPVRDRAAADARNLQTPQLERAIRSARHGRERAERRGDHTERATYSAILAGLTGEARRRCVRL